MPDRDGLPVSASVWRWLVAVLVVANMVLAVVHLRTGERNAAAEEEIPPPDPRVPRLVLLHERPPAEVETIECFTIGPLNSLLAQQRAQDRLRADAAQVRGRQTSLTRDLGWWVYLPVGSRSDALAATRELAEAGMEDFFVMTRGEMENLVSVGLYEDIDNARGRQRQMQARGFNAELETRRESVPQFWVDYRREGNGDSAWQFILEASPGAQHRPIPCWDD